MVLLILLCWDTKRAQRLCTSPFNARIRVRLADPSQVPGPSLQCVGRGKHLRVEGAANAYELGRKPPQLTVGKHSGWRCPEKPCFLLGPVLATGLCLGCCEAHADLLLEKGSVSDMPEKGDRSERADWGRMFTSAREATWELISLTAVICTSRQPSAPITGKNVSYSPFYLAPLSESVVTVPLWTDFGQSRRMHSALCLPYPRAISYLWSLWTGRGDCCHHPLFL